MAINSRSNSYSANTFFHFSRKLPQKQTQKDLLKEGDVYYQRKVHISCLTKPHLIVHSKFNIFSSIRYFFLALKRVCVHFSIYFRLIVFSTTSLYLSLALLLSLPLTVPHSIFYPLFSFLTPPPLLLSTLYSSSHSPLPIPPLPSDYSPSIHVYLPPPKRTINLCHLLVL